MILGIESSCDETAAAVVTPEGVVRSNVVTSQIPIHARFGGVVPELASRNHLVAIRPVIDQALADAGVALDAVTAVAVTTGPGLAGCLLVGLQVGKAIAWARGLPLVPVDHIHAHVHAPYLIDHEGSSAKGLDYPHVALAVSGGHTSLVCVDGPARVTTLGQTLDDAAGEAFDKVAKLMGLPYPGGVHIDRIAESGDPARFDLPRPLMGKGLDFSFSGLKTAARLTWEAHGEGAKADLAASVQEAIVDVLVAKALAACRATGIPRLVVAGGVACNRRLRQRLSERAARAAVRAVIAPARYCSDNAAMVAGLGAALLADGHALTGRDVLAADIYVTTRPERAERAAG
ncbi:MAG: tRNA (adenosine(37)-N6)-threonylcarbamoyltransferase complex transferase subunit TsaD [Deltaproteobacteria bacterium]|nr:tRNA (adenosine(37)-N6)-threonylcarbamoyltransferase complex transferase subunit TsaD [Deltaproteobacteria bacterium]